MGTIQYQSCTPGDIDAVLEFWESATHGGSTNTREAILTFLELHPELFILAWDDEVLVGTVLGAWDGWRANFARLAVHDGYRQLGIDRELVERAEMLLVQRGAERCKAGTRQCFGGQPGRVRILALCRLHPEQNGRALFEESVAMTWRQKRHWTTGSGAAAASLRSFCGATWPLPSL